MSGRRARIQVAVIVATGTPAAKAAKAAIHNHLDRLRADHPDATWSASPQPCQIGADRRLVDKYQPGRIKHALLSYPTSARSRHICSLPFGSLQAFFEGNTVAAEKSRKRTLAGVTVTPAQLGNRLQQCQVWMLCNHSQNPRRALLQWRNASSARFRRSTSRFASVLMPLDHRTHAHLETVGRLMSRSAHLDGLDHSFTQVCGIGPRHCQPS